jgi:hypothetical protein
MNRRTFSKKATGFLAAIGAAMGIKAKGDVVEPVKTTKIHGSWTIDQIRAPGCDVLIGEFICNPSPSYSEGAMRIEFQKSHPNGSTTRERIIVYGAITHVQLLPSSVKRRRM